MDKEFRVKLGLSDQEFFRKYHAVKERVEKQEVKVPVSLEFDGERSAIDEAKKSVSGETIEIKARIKGLDSEIKDAESSLEALQKYSNIDIANKKSAKEAKEAVERVNATIDEMAQKLQSLEGKGDKQGLIKYAKEVYEYLIAANEEVRKFNENTSGKRLEYFDDGSIADVVDEFEKSYKELNELSENFYKILDGEIKAPKIDTSGIDKAKARLKELSEEKRLLENELKSQPTIKADTEVNEGGLTEQLTKLKDKLTGVLNGLLIDTVSISPEAINVLRGKIESALDNVKIGIQNKDEINELLQKIIDIKGVDLSEGVGFSDDDNKLISESTKTVHKLGLELKKISEYIGEINTTPIDIQYTNLDELNSVLDSINSEFKKVSDVLSKGIKVSKAKKASGEGIDSLIEKLNAQVDAFRLQFKEILDSFTIENINIDPEVLSSLKNKIQESFREIAISVDYLEPNTPEQIEKVTKIKSELNELNQLNNILDTIIEKVSKKNDLFVEEKDVVAKATKSELPKLGKLSDSLEEVSKQLVDIRVNGEAVDILPNLSTKLSELRELAESLENISQRFNDIRVSGESFNALSNLSVNLSGASNELAKTLLRISEANQWIRNNRSWSKTQNQTGELERAGYVNLKTGVVDNLEYYDRGDSFDGIEYIKDKIKNKYAVDKVGDIFDALLHTHPLQQGRTIKNIGRDGAFSGAIDENLEVTGDVGTFINELNEGVKKFILLSDDLVTILDLSDLSLDKAKEALRTYAGENNKIINERAGEWLNLTDANGKKYNDRSILTKLSDEAWKKTFSQLKISDNSIDGQSKKHIEHIELSDFVQRYGVNPSELADSIAKKANDAVQEAVNDAAAKIELRNINIENNNTKYSKSRDGFTTTDYQNLRYAFEANKDFDFGELGTGADVLKVIDNWGRLTQKDFSNFSELVEQIRQRNVEDGRNLNEVKQAYNYYKQRSDEIFKDINGNSVSGNEIAKILDTRKNGKNKDRWQMMPKEELDYILKQVNLVANAEEKVTKEAEKQTKVHQSNAEKLDRQKEAAEKLRSYLNNIWAGKDNELKNYNIQDILKNVSDGDWKEISENLSSKMKKALEGYNSNSVDPYNSTKKQRELFKGYSQNLVEMAEKSDKISLSENKEDVVSLIQDWFKLEQQIKETWGVIQNNAPEVKLSKINTLLTRLTRELNSAGKAPRSLRVDAENLISELTTIRDRTVDAKEEWTDLSRVRLNDLQNQVNKIVVDLQEFKGKGFFDKIRASFTQASAQFIGYFFSLPDLLRYARQMYDVTREVDSAMIELKKVSNDTSSAVERSFSNMTKTAKDYGSSISNIISLTANWSRLGYNLPDSQELARVTQLYTNVGDGISSEQASESLISTLQGFKLSADSAEDIVDKFNEVGNNFAISSAGIGEALQRSAASFTAANTNLSQAIALVTATNEVVQDPDAVGTMWTTVSARIRGAKTELEEMGEDTEGVVTSTSKLRDLVKGIAGVDIMENETTFKDIYTIVDQIGHRWQDINDINQAALLEALAGKRQANRLVAVLNNVEGLEAAYEAATNAAGSAEKEQSRYAESVNYSIERAKANLQELITNILPTDATKKITDFGASALELLGKLTSGSNSLGRTLGAITGALSTFIPKLSGLQGFNIDLGNLEKSSGWIINLGKGIKNLPEGLSRIKEGFRNLSKKDTTWDGAEIVSDEKYEKLTEAINAYNASIDENKKDSAKAILSAEELREAYGEEVQAVGELVQKNAGAKISMEDLNVAARSTTLRFKALSIASKALNTALNMLIGMGIGFLIQGIATAIDNVVHKAENTRKAAREVADEIKNVNQSLKDNQKLVAESGEEYLKLSKGVNDFGKNISLSKEDYDRYVELSKSMAEVFPELIKGYNDLNEPILRDIESLKELNDLLEKQREQSNYNIVYGKSEDNKGKTNFQVQTEAFKNNYKSTMDDLSDEEQSIVDMINNDFEGFMDLMEKYIEIQEEGLQKNWFGDMIKAEMKARGGNALANLYDVSNNQKSSISNDITTFSNYAKSSEYKEAREAIKNGENLTTEQQKVIDNMRHARKAFAGESQQIESDNQEYIDQMRSQLSAFVNIADSFGDLTDEQKSYALTFANNMSGKWFRDILTDSDVNDEQQFDIFANNIVDAINSENEKVKGAFASLFNLDEETKDMTYDQYRDFIQGILQAIIDEFGESRPEIVEAFKSILGYIPNRQEAYDTTKRQVEGHLAEGYVSTSEVTTKSGDNGYAYQVNKTGSDRFVEALEGMSKSDYDFVSSGKLSTDAWSDFNAKVKEAGGLAVLEINKIQDLISEAIKKTGAKIEEDTKTTGSDLVKTLQSQMAPALNALGEAYNAIFNGGENGDEFNMAAVTIAQLESVRSAVESLTSNEEWGIKVDTADVDKLINILGNVNTTAEDAQAAFDNFATSIANAVIPNIEHLTEASYQAGIQALQEMGIVNAEEVLISRIGLSLEEFKEAKEAANAAGINTDGDIKNLSDLNMADIKAQDSLAKLIAEKIRTNGITIQTNGDIANLISLANAAYGTAGALAEVYDEINELNGKAKAARDAGRFKESEAIYAQANAKLSNFSSSSWVQARMNELYNNAKVSVDFDGGNAANSAGSSGSGGSGGSDSDTKDEFSEEIDWIERRQKALSDALTDIQGVVDFTYADWDARLAHIGMKYQNLTDQITLSQQAMERYQRAMAEVGLDEDYAAKVRAGIIDLETITDEALKGQIDSYQGYYDKFVQYEQQFNDLTRQRIALIQDEVDQLRSRFEDIDEDLAHLNTLSDSSINRGTIYQQLGSLLDKRVHTEMQLENVLKEREAIEAKIAQYEGDTNSEGYHDLIKNLKDCDEQAEGFKDTLQEIAKARFDTVAEQFDRIAESIDHATSRINSLADTAEAQGFYASDEFIKANLAMEEDRRSNLYKERAELEKALAEGVANGSITEGSNTWNEMNEKIEETTDNIYASTAAIEKYKDELRNWQWEAQDWIRERANRAHDTNDFMIEQLGTDKLFEKNGNWNDSATSTQGLHVLNYSMYLDESRKLAEEIKKIDEEMANDPYDVKLIARKEELIDLQREAIRNANDEKEAIRSLVKEGYDTFLDYLQKAIDKRKEALEAEQTLYEYEKNVRDQAKQIASYQKQLASLSGDTSEENQLRVQQLNNSLAEAQEQLQETQYEKWVSDQEQMMDEMYNQFDELINERLDNLDRLVQDAVNTTDQNGTKIANTVSQKADSIGVDIRNGFGGIDYDSALSGIDGDIQTQTSTLNNTLETQGQAIIKAAQDAALSIKGEMTKPGTDDTNYARDDSGLKDVVSDTPTSKNTPTLANGAMAYRLYNPNSGQHLITTNASEAEGLVKLGWNREGETLFSPNEGKPVTRLYNPNNGDHLYTTNSSEIKTLKALGWNDEGEAFKTSDDGVDVYRLYNPNNGLHHFTTSEEERDHLKSLGWNYEGVAFRSMGKFAKGGTVGKAVKGTGEDGFILARTGEEVLSLDKIKGMQQVLTMFEPLTKLQQKMPNGISTLGGNNVTIGDVTTTLSLPNVTNYEDFVNKAKADPKFERLVQQMTIGNALGQSKLKKYSI